MSTADFENMTVGMVIDYLITCQNEDTDDRKKQNGERRATQGDIDAW